MFLELSNCNLLERITPPRLQSNFGVGRTMANLQRYVCWPNMQERVARLIRGCVLCYTSRPRDRKQGLYHPFHVPTRPWENISMDFMGGLLKTRKGHEFLFVVVDSFSMMCVLMPCRKTIDEQESKNFFFGQVRVHFWISGIIASDRSTIFLSALWSTFWENMDTKLKRSTTSHLQIDGQTKLVKETFAQLLRGYNQKHLKTWDENMVYI